MSETHYFFDGSISMARKKKCYSGIGGQAVLEGIMMKNNTRYSVAVRKPDGEIDVEIGEYTGFLGGSKLTKLPFIRGVFSFADSLRLGTKCLNHSAAFYAEEEGTQESAADKMLNKVFKDKAESILMMLTTIVAVVFAVGIFMVLPYFISSYLERFVRNESLLAIIEGVIRILIFVAYVLLISLMKDIRRVYMYHGAEHKCINCIEKGRELTVENVMRSSKQHRRCGTSFLLFVMLISVVLFFFIRVDNMALKVLIRILLIPVIAGIAYEIIRLAGRSDNWLVRMISAPGLWLQGLTTKEPDEGMVEVAIKAVEAVFDWRAYLRENFGYEDAQEAEQADERDAAAEYAAAEQEQVRPERIQIEPMRIEQIQKDAAEEAQVRREALREERKLREPVRREGVREEALQEERKPTEPVRRRRVQEEPVQEGLIQKEQFPKEAALEERKQRKPVRRERIQEEPAEEEKIRIEAALKEPKPAEPVRRKRVRKESVEEGQIPEEALQEERKPTEPVRRRRVQKEPIQKEPVQEGSVQKEQFSKEAVSEEKNQRKPVRRKRIQEEPAGEEKIRIEAALEEPKPAEPVRRRRVQKEPIQKEPVQEGSVQKEQFSKEAVLEEKNQRKPVRRKRIQEEPAGEEKIRIEAALEEPKPAEPVRRKRVRKEPVQEGQIPEEAAQEEQKVPRKRVRSNGKPKEQKVVRTDLSIEDEDEPSFIGSDAIE